MFSSEKTRRTVSAACAGFFTALSLPPWGWWPLLFVGVAWFALLTNENGQSKRSNVWVSTVWSIAWLAPATWWMKSLSFPGYILAVIAFAGFHALAELLAQLASYREPIDGRRTHLRLITQACAHTLAECLRFSFPFGGVPLASFGIALAGSPFVYLARYGGVILLTFFTFVSGIALSRIASRPSRVGISLICTLVLLSATLPRLTSFSHQVGTLRIAIVQGGGPQGTHAIDSDPIEVLNRHLEATQKISKSDEVDLVLWPENVIDVADFSQSSALTQVVTQAKRLGVPFLVGVTEDAGIGHFTNAQMVVQPDGSISDRYDKVRRVPFGEYMPLRGILDALGAPVDLVPTDAIAGTGPAVLQSNDTTLAVAISWEIFFGGRVNEGVEHGGQVVINPTNGSSYTGTILQTQQVASSRLRAIESGRWVAQAAPTGFSAFISENGDVLDRSSVSETKVLIRDVELREGRTIYSRIGDAPLIATLLLAMAICVDAMRLRPIRKAKRSAK